MTLALRLSLLFSFLLLLAGPAWAGESFPSALQFPLNEFPGGGVCVGTTDGFTASTAAATPLSISGPPFCQIDPNNIFMYNPQFDHIIPLVGPTPPFSVSVPEPATFLLLGSGLVGLAALGRRRRQ